MPNVKLNVPLPNQGLDTSAPGEYLDPRSSPDLLNVEIIRSVKKAELSAHSGDT